MKKYIFLLILLTTNLSFGQNAESALITGDRHSITSKHLGEERTFQVYLPPSYFFSKSSNFPVVYLIDGDYNFHYDTGLIESLSEVANRIPEMIVIGISDKGNTKYKKNCTLASASSKEGNARNFMAFIEKELKPHIQKNYRTSTYDIIIGHSIGGLFVTNYFLENPKAFDNYIAIDPSYWWDDFEVISRADSLFKDRKELESNLFVSLAATKGMGVQQFVGVLDKYYPNQQKWTYLHYPDESHGSVGLITISDALQAIFKGWEISRKKFYSFKTAQDVIDNYKKFTTDYSTSFSIPSYSLGNIVYFYFRRELAEDLKILESGINQHFPSSSSDFYTQLALNHFEKGALDKAEEMYKKGIQSNPLSFKSYEGLSKLYLEQKEFEKATANINKCLKIAQQVKVRQWLLNELRSTEEKIKTQMKTK